MTSGIIPFIPASAQACIICGSDEDLQNIRRGKQFFRDKLCRRCYGRDQALRKRYKIQISDYMSMLAEQRGRCAICNEHFGMELVVDHNHKTGAVRKLLCSACNFLVGAIENRKAPVQVVEDYLQNNA